MVLNQAQAVKIRLQKTRTLDLKIRKQISPICILLIGNMNGTVNASVAIQKMRRRLHRKVHERIK